MVCRWGCALAVVLMGLGWASVARAESDSVVTLGFSGRLSFQKPGQSLEGGEDYLLHAGMRVELLYLLGAEFEAAYVPDRLSGDIYRPGYRLTGHLHMANYQYFDLYLGVGLASGRFKDVVDVEGETTVYRVGSGMEIILGGHWGLGAEVYWSVAGLGHFNKRLTESLQNEQGIPDPLDQVDPGQIEVGIALRYYL